MACQRKLLQQYTIKTVTQDQGGGIGTNNPMQRHCSYKYMHY